jgi:hypothetical protein
VQPRLGDLAVAHRDDVGQVVLQRNRAVGPGRRVRGERTLLGGLSDDERERLSDLLARLLESMAES